jgi:hypothetical protein
MCEGAGIKERQAWMRGFFVLCAALILFILLLFSVEHCSCANIDERNKQRAQQWAEKRDKLCLDLCKTIDGKRLRHDHDRCFCKDTDGCITVFSSTRHRLYNNPKTIGKCAEVE